MRLALSPVFDANSIEEAAKMFQHVLSRAERTGNTNEYSKWLAHWQLQSDLMHSMIGEETDARVDIDELTVFPSDIRALDAAEVCACVCIVLCALCLCLCVWCVCAYVFVCMCVLWVCVCYKKAMMSF